MPTITYLGHSGVMIQHARATLLIDPFITGNPRAVHKVSDLKPTHIAVTHGHADHVGDTVALATATGATVHAVYEICEFLGSKGVKHLEPMNPGGQVRTSFGFIALTKAFHSSSLEGRYMGQPTGVIARFDAAEAEKALTVYHCGDTDLFGDMALIGEIYRPDIAFIPIEDRFTMGPGLASRAAELIRPRAAVPIHFGTWPPIEVDVGAFRPSGVEVRVLSAGERWGGPG